MEANRLAGRLACWPEAGKKTLKLRTSGQSASKPVGHPAQQQRAALLRQCPPSSCFTAWIISTMTFWASPYTMLVLSAKKSSFSTPE